MHVMCFVHYYASHVRAGSETFLHELVLPLVEAGHQVSALATAHGGPRIANPTPGILESHRFAPIYVDHRDTDGWVEAVQSLDDPDVWKKYSDRSLKQAGFLDPEPQLELRRELVEGLANAGRNGASAWWKANRATRFGPLLGIQGLG